MTQAIEIMIWACDFGSSGENHDWISDVVNSTLSQAVWVKIC